MCPHCKTEIVRPHRNQHSPYYTKYKLTVRELEVSRLLIKGATTKEMGRKLGMTYVAAIFHIGNIKRKLNAHTRVSAAVILVKELSELDRVINYFKSERSNNSSSMAAGQLK